MSPRSQKQIARIGGPKSYSDLAAEKALGKSAAASFSRHRSFRRCLMATREGRSRYAVVPVENNITGKIADKKDGPTVEEMASTMSLVRVKKIRLRVRHILASRSKLGCIRMVYSKRQALEQCRQFFKNNKKMLPVHVKPGRKEITDTSAAASHVKRMNVSYAAAICNAEAAAYYGLHVIKSTGIADRKDNVTTFFVYARESSPGVGRTAARRRTGKTASKRRAKRQA